MVPRLHCRSLFESRRASFADAMRPQRGRTAAAAAAAFPGVSAGRSPIKLDVETKATITVWPVAACLHGSFIYIMTRRPLAFHFWRGVN